MSTCKRGHVDPPRVKGWCNICRALLRRRYLLKANNGLSPEQVKILRDRGRASRLGVSLGIVRSIIEASGGRCEACFRELTHAEMCVDHDHATGRVRGVLCAQCNVLEGQLLKEAARVNQIADYIEKTRSRVFVPGPVPSKPRIPPTLVLSFSATRHIEITDVFQSRCDVFQSRCFPIIPKLRLVSTAPIRDVPVLDRSDVEFLAEWWKGGPNPHSVSRGIDATLSRVQPGTDHESNAALWVTRKLERVAKRGGA